MKKFLTGILIIVLMLLFAAGIRKNDVVNQERIEPDIVTSSADIKKTGSDAEIQVAPINAAETNKISPETPTSEQTEVNQKVNNAIAADKTNDAATVTSEVPVTQASTGNSKITDATEVVPQPVLETITVSDSTEHTHNWVDEVVAYHEAETHTVHHDAITEERWVPVIQETMYYYCDVCRQRFSSQEEVYAHEDATTAAAIEAGDMSLAHSGHSTMVDRQDHGYYETVVVQEAYDETIVDKPAWEEHIFRCSICGATA